MNIRGILPLSASYLKSLCSCCDNNDEEKISFAKYERFDDDDQELKDASEWKTLDGATFCVEEAHEDPANKITEWQAGWNVTNAIQVRISTFF